jgi:hypothetical protein
MPVTYVYQDTYVLNQIAPELIQSTALDDPIFQYFPIREHNVAKLRWTIKDRYRGLMNPRGLGGSPTRVLRPGESLYEELPGVYGEFGQLDELELTDRARGFPADMTIAMDVSDMVREWQQVLTVRQVQRMRQTAWTLATTHNLLVPLPSGGVGHAASFTGQTLTVATLWSNLTTATPLHDLRQIQITYGRGTSNNFMAQAEAWMNLKTAQYLLDNRNNADVGGIRAEYGATVFNSIEKFNEILLSQGAPRIRIYEDSYQNDNTDPTANDFTMYLPDGVVWVCAQRPGNEKPGEFMWTRHAVNGGGTRPYAFTRDFSKDTQGRPEVPPRIEVHQGFNGGPVQERPSQTVTMIVA